MNDTIPTLEGFIEPEAVRFMPDAPGWYILEGLLLFIILAAVVFVWKNYRRNRYRRIAISWLEQEEARLLANKNYHRLIYISNMLAKRIVINLHEREQAASLRGSFWLDYLNKTCPTVTFSIVDEDTINAIYSTKQSLSEQQTIAFTTKIKQWIKKHRI